ncbi:MAG: cobalamin B12-binding domain-containing protein [Deltaproteobacteria bacterium]|nr:cobalamin B12-binding domain-containing protein [Deltaproteobacteria bacterium]
MTVKKIKNRVLIAKPGLDGHDRGAKIIARALRDSEFEVIYTGIRQTPEEIVSTAIQEDVAAIGLSSLSGAHLRLFPAVVAELEKRDAADIRVLGGGIIPDDDIETLKKAGIEAIFTPGAPLADIIDAFKRACDTFYGRKQTE